MPPWIRDPESNFSCIWDVAQLIFLLYVSCFVPLRTCFNIDYPMDSTWFVLDNIVDAYFIADLILNFRTAITSPDGHREDRPAKIAKAYLKVS